MTKHNKDNKKTIYVVAGEGPAHPDLQRADRRRGGRTDAP